LSIWDEKGRPLLIIRVHATGLKDVVEPRTAVVEEISALRCHCRHGCRCSWGDVAHEHTVKLSPELDTKRCGAHYLAFMRRFYRDKLRTAFEHGACDVLLCATHERRQAQVRAQLLVMRQAGDGLGPPGGEGERPHRAALMARLAEVRRRVQHDASFSFAFV
jgi:hypothetical protein